MAIPSPFADASTTVKVGFSLFGVGLVFLAVTVVPFFFGDHNRSLWLNLGCMLAPVGFIVAVASTVRQTRATQRAAVAELYGAPTWHN